MSIGYLRKACNLCTYKCYSTPKVLVKVNNSLTCFFIHQGRFWTWMPRSWSGFGFQYFFDLSLCFKRFSDQPNTGPRNLSAHVVNSTADRRILIHLGSSLHDGQQSIRRREAFLLEGRILKEGGGFWKRGADFGRGGGVTSFWNFWICPRVGCIGLFANTWNYFGSRAATSSVYVHNFRPHVLSKYLIHCVPFILSWPMNKAKKRAGTR